jgi:hypothetical protein
MDFFNKFRKYGPFSVIIEPSFNYHHIKNKVFENFLIIFFTNI